VFGDNIYKQLICVLHGILFLRMLNLEYTLCYIFKLTERQIFSIKTALAGFCAIYESPDCTEYMYVTKNTASIMLYII